MLNIDEIREQLGDRNLKQVSRKTGLNYNTVFYFCRKEDSNPSYETVRKLSNYLEGKEDD
ncbi:MAG: helix-turn-helix domain-containing protein [Thermodesulfobacteriota bacterium]